MQVDLCRHIKTNGLQCRGIALDGSVFCYFHNKLHRSHQLYRNKTYFQPELISHTLFLELPATEDRASIQLAISEIVTAVAKYAMDPKRAGILLYALQIASSTGIPCLRLVARVCKVPSPG